MVTKGSAAEKGAVFSCLILVPSVYFLIKEILLYERYRDRKDWEVTHMSKPYIKELLAELPKYIEGDVIREEYELVEFD